MREKKLVVNGKKLTYKGIFNQNDFFSTIRNKVIELGYDYSESKQEEIITNEGKRSLFELRPTKGIANYAALMIKIVIIFDRMEEIFENGKKYNRADVDITFDGWVLTDYEYRWGMNPWPFFLKGLIHKYLFKLSFDASFGGKVSSDLGTVFSELRYFFSQYSKEKKQPFNEEDVIKKVQEEIINPTK